MKIVVVEDGLDHARIINAVLKKEGFEVIHFASGVEAYDYLKANPLPDLLITDVMMPGGMNGLELAREIRSRRGVLPILLTSGYAGPVRHQAEVDGFSILPKPYSLDQLSKALTHLLQDTRQS